MAKDIFISYKSEDYAQAEWIKGVLEHNGISCWMAPACIPGGSNYAAEIPKAIRECRVFVLVLSRKAQESKWVPKEVDQAINEGKTIMPFMLENFELRDDFNFYLSNIQRYTAYENKALAAEKMLREIRAILNITAEQPPVQQPPVQQKPQTVYHQPVQPRSSVAPPVVNQFGKTKSDANPYVFGIISLFFAIVSLGVIFSPVSILLAAAGLILCVTWSNKAPVDAVKGKGLVVGALVANGLLIIAAFCVALYGGGFVLGLAADAVCVWLFVKGRKKVK